jgi:hypothetical protein
MKPQEILPKRVVSYIQDIGVRALDHLANHMDAAPPPVAPEGETPDVSANATQTLVDQWKSMSPADKDQFVERVSGSVMEVIVATATLPLGLKKTAKKAEKVIRKQVKRVRKAAAAKKKAKSARAKAKPAKAKPKPPKKKDGVTKKNKKKDRS